MFKITPIHYFLISLTGRDIVPSGEDRRVIFLELAWARTIPSRRPTSPVTQTERQTFSDFKMSTRKKNLFCCGFFNYFFTTKQDHSELLQMVSRTFSSEYIFIEHTHKTYALRRDLQKGFIIQKNRYIILYLRHTKKLTFPNLMTSV